MYWRKNKKYQRFSIIRGRRVFWDIGTIQPARMAPKFWRIQLLPSSALIYLDDGGSRFVWGFHIFLPDSILQSPVYECQMSALFCGQFHNVLYTEDHVVSNDEMTINWKEFLTGYGLIMQLSQNLLGQTEENIEKKKKLVWKSMSQPGFTPCTSQLTHS